METELIGTTNGSKNEEDLMKKMKTTYRFERVEITLSLFNKIEFSFKQTKMRKKFISFSKK